MLEKNLNYHTTKSSKKINFSDSAKKKQQNSIPAFVIPIPLSMMVKVLLVLSGIM
jgi:hypothetical protein